MWKFLEYGRAKKSEVFTYIKAINLARSKTVKLPVNECNSRAVASFRLP
jgi:hypothetical protein